MTTSQELKNLAISYPILEIQSMFFQIMSKNLKGRKTSIEQTTVSIIQPETNPQMY